MPDGDEHVVLHTRDPLVERRVQRGAQRLGLRALQASRLPAGPGVAGLLVALELDDAIDLVAGWRDAAPALPIVGYLTVPDAELWKRAEDAGADLVTTRGVADRRFLALVDDRRSGRAAARRIRLASYRDFAGRLGYVGRIDETPAGPISIFHVSNAIYAISDVCPHAGASLCDGTVDGDIVTCPRHGSQFSVIDGRRVRGPADLPVASFRVVVEAGDVFVELPE